jgi:hypothetical protein
VRRSVEEWKIGMTVVTATGEVLGPLGVREVPSTVFIDASGVIVTAASGPRSYRFLAERTQALLESSR